MADQLNLNELIVEVDELLTEAWDITQSQQDLIQSVQPEHRTGAENLLHYAWMRRNDLRRLQDALHDLGVTSLSTSEYAIRARLLALRNALGALTGQGTIYYVGEIAEDMAHADDCLESNSVTLLGEETEGANSRIMVTLPAEAADDYELVLELAEAGMDIARINCAHDDATQWEKMIANVGRAGEQVGKLIGINMDLAGPKLRTGDIVPGPNVGRARVTRDDAGQVVHPAKLWITPKPYMSSQTPAEPPADLPGRPALPIQVDGAWFDALAVGKEIRLHDARGSKRKFIVTKVLPHGVLAEGDRNAYLADGQLIECDYERTRIAGIPPVLQKMRLETDEEVILTADPAATVLGDDGPLRISCTLPEAVSALKPGERVFFDDGAIAAVVVSTRTAEETDAYPEATLRVTRAKPGGQNLAAHKGINLPETNLPLPSLTEEDEENMRFVATHADIMAVSFIRDEKDVQYVIGKLYDYANELEAAGDQDGAAKVRHVGLVLKIETIPGFQNLPNILLEGMKWRNLGVMIARGDLAVELGFDRLAEVPGQIMSLCTSGHIPVILGTQVLENLAKTGLPSRAEITDAAFALRAESVMLNKGPHITDAIEILDNLSRKLGSSQRKNRIMLRRIRSWDETADAVADTSDVDTDAADNN